MALHDLTAFISHFRLNHLSPDMLDSLLSVIHSHLRPLLCKKQFLIFFKCWISLSQWGPHWLLGLRLHLTHQGYPPYTARIGDEVIPGPGTSLIYSFSITKCLLNVHCMLGIMLDMWSTSVNKTDKNSCSQGAKIPADSQEWMINN